MMSGFNESFRMYLLPLISKTWDENLWGITCSFLHWLKTTLVGDCMFLELLPGFLQDFIDFSFSWRCSRTLLTSLGMAPSWLALGEKWGKFLCSLRISMAKEPSFNAMSPQCAPCSLKWFYKQWNSAGFWIDGFTCSTLWHPDQSLRPMGTPPALEGENCKSKSKPSCLVEVFGHLC